ncbi:uncharacterized protein LAJ45_03524 [Morchella importuna]|uniref:uncharacterized protein n=1 Tax=Morchella importuna TaxID=1174673 RepID=UPI001E8DC7B6|nr:uncharacterized protein LAJ45_03524 [Morchella importuna]KAH8152683.1 hypothetical protein LAJ45_03524 [Morchella importuna]
MHGESEKKEPVAEATTNNSDTASIEKTAGVAKIEGVTLAWSKVGLWTAWAGIMLLAVAVSLDSQTIYSYQPMATSTFGAHSLLATIGTVQNIMYAVTKPPVAKIADVFGRFEAFTFSVVLLTLGFILEAASQDIGTFAAAQIFYVAGQVGIQFMQQIFAADTTNLKWRALFNALPLAPFLFTTWCGAPIVERVLRDSTWRWGYGMYAIIIPACAIPLLISLGYHQHKASKAGVISNKDKNSALLRDPVALFSQLDILGLTLFTAGLTLVLLPMTLAARYPDKWASSHIIVMLVVGVICLIVFPIWEVYFAKTPILSLDLLKDRTVLGGCGVVFFAFCAFYIYQPYFYSYLVVVRGHSYKAATNIVLASSFASTASGLIIAFAVRYTGNYKWVVVAGICIKIIGGGLMFRYRDIDSSTAQLVMGQVIFGIGTGLLNVIQVGVQAAVKHRDVASVTALLATGYSVGGAVGDSISGGIWTNLLPQKLALHLPNSNATEIASIRDNFVVASSTYLMGSAERTGINRAYDEVMRIQLMVALILLFVPLGFIAITKDINLKEADENNDYGGVVIGNHGRTGRQHDEGVETKN